MVAGGEGYLGCFLLVQRGHGAPQGRQGAMGRMHNKAGKEHCNKMSLNL